MLTKNTYRSFFTIYIPFLLALTLGFIIFISIEHSHFFEIIKNNERLQLELAKKSLVRDFEFLLPDMEVLTNERHVQQFITDFEKVKRHLVEQEFASFARQKGSYRTIRFIGLDGMERVRIDYRDGKVVIAPEQVLQNKSNRYYYQEGIKLSQSELYISPIDLNIENGKIEMPYTPMIRFAMPVYDSNKIKKGLLVVNFNAQTLLQHFDEMLAGSYGHIALLNQDGFWIRSHQPEQEWGFMFNRELRYANDYPQEWDIIKAQDNGQLHTGNGLMSFASLYPIKLIGGYSDVEVKNQHVGHHHINPDSYSWKIVSNISADKIKQNIYQHVFGLVGFIWLILAISGLFTSRYLAINYQERKNLRNQLELHGQIYRSSTDGAIITDAEQKIVDVNHAFLEICGYSLDEIIGNKPSMFSSGHHDREFYQNMRQDLHKNDQWEGEINNRHKNGSIYTEWIRITIIRDEQGKISNYIALISDITHKKSTEEQLLKRAHHDPLTGAHNRLSFNERFKHELLLAKRNNREMALLYFDLDKFKPINDTHGHQAGDLVLKSVVERISKNIRETDTLARLGGDEFVVILAEVLSDKDVKQVVNTLCSHIQEPIQYKNIPLQVKASVGIAIYPRDGNTEQALLDFADRQMYINKMTT